MTEISSEGVALQEEIKEGAHEVGHRLGSLVFRGAVAVGSPRLSHWLEPGAVVALESQLNEQTMDEFYADIEGLSDRVVEAVSQVSNIPVEQLIGSGKGRDEVMARQVAMYMIRHHGEVSYPRIAKVFSKDHTTVMYAVKKIEALLGLEKGMPAGKTTILIKQVESTIAGYLGVVNEAMRNQESPDLLDAIAVTQDGLHSYPAGKIKLLYLKALRIRDPDILVLEHDKRTITDELLRQYGELALSLLGGLKS